VEAIYSRQELVTSDTDTIFVGGGILENTSQNYQTIFNIVNYILGLIAFTILCFIIYQGYLMLFNSNNEEGIKKMRKNLLYIFGGLLLIGLSYIIVNFVVINP
jgi:heptaprenylglyceryl phosphate synthase